MLAGVDEMLLLRDLTHLALVQCPQRQADMSQLLLRQVVKHIALIFSFVQTLLQQPATGGLVLLHAGIVACDHILHPMLPCPGEKVVELHIPVAVDAGIRGAARLIDPDEFFDDLFPEVGGEIQHLIGDIHRIRHLGGIFDVLFRAAGVKAGLAQRLVAGEPHRNTGAGIALLLHQPGCNRAVYAAAHRNERTGAACILCFCHFVPHVITYKSSSIILPHVRSLVKTQRPAPLRPEVPLSHWGAAR